MQNGLKAWSLLFDQSPFPGLVTSPQSDGLVVALNDSAARYFRAEPQQLLGLPLRCLLSVELLEYGCLPQSQALLARIVHSGPSYGELVELFQLEFESSHGPRNLNWLNRPHLARPFPKPSPHSARSLPAANARPPHRIVGPRILVAVDDPVNSKVIGKLLLALGCLVELTANGQLALERFDQAPFDLVLLDCHMPVLDGISTAQALRARGLAIPLIALTADATDANRHNCASAGFNLFLTKPVSKQSLASALYGLLPHFVPPAFD